MRGYNITSEKQGFGSFVELQLQHTMAGTEWCLYSWDCVRGRLYPSVAHGPDSIALDTSK